MKPSIVVAIPCYNEAITIEKVIHDFQKVLPDAEIHVFNNNSIDGSEKLAEGAGAIVHNVYGQGKGYVTRNIFDNIKADAVVFVDGDDTYFAEEAPVLLQPILDGSADMVVGNRLKGVTDHSMRSLHQTGNRLIVIIVNCIFRGHYQDILSGYRVFNRRFIESIPLMSKGFEIETEMTIQSLVRDMRIVEIPISYRSRPEGSSSKLRSFQDGYRILLTAILLLRDHQPLRLFGLASFIFFIITLMAAILRFLAYININTFPDALLTGLILLFAPLSLLSLGIGLELNTVNTRFQEIEQLLKRSKRTDD